MIYLQPVTVTLRERYLLRRGAGKNIPQNQFEFLVKRILQIKKVCRKHGFEVSINAAGTKLVRPGKRPGDRRRFIYCFVEDVLRELDFDGRP